MRLVVIVALTLGCLCVACNDTGDGEGEGDFTLRSETNATGSIQLDFVTSGESFLRARVAKAGAIDIGYQLTKIAPQ